MTQTQTNPAKVTTDKERTAELVSKIKSFGYPVYLSEKGNYGFKMCRKVVEVYLDDTKIVIIKTKESDRFKSLYKAVLSFIEYYNTTQNKQV